MRERKASDDLNSLLNEAEKGSAVFQSERAQRGRSHRATREEMEKAKSEKNASDTAAGSGREPSFVNFENKLSDDAAALAAQQEIAAKGSDVRDLVVARNLHIIDVHDRDGNGKSQRAFGRIFYTEGKSLIFYAYDLADPRKLDARVSFYVWGERLGAEKPIRSLGIFHDDDAKDGRWVLTFDDPQVLAQINSVFVTAESAKKSIKEPGGQENFVRLPRGQAEPSLSKFKLCAITSAFARSALHNSVPTVPSRGRSCTRRHWLRLMDWKRELYPYVLSLR